MKKILNILLLAMALPTALSAQEKMRHQLRWGWGDMLFETMAFHPSPAHSYPVSVTLGDPSRTYFWDYISERQAEDDFTTLYLYYYSWYICTRITALWRVFARRGRTASTCPRIPI